MRKRATQTLQEEHHLIHNVLGAMVSLADKMQEGHQASKETLHNFLDFTSVFVKECHHEKEDNHLFPLLVKKGVLVAGCPIDELVHEHQSAEKLTASLSACVAAYLKNPSKTGQILVTTTYGIVAHYPSHIWKENYLLLPLTD
jgi:hemerythrin-like domain-containing protein